MPIYEYKCKACDTIFEHLHLGGEEKTVTCPHCRSVLVDKQFSSFATPKGGQFCPADCGPGGGCCGNRERKCFE